MAVVSAAVEGQGRRRDGEPSGGYRERRGHGAVMTVRRGDDGRAELPVEAKQQQRDERGSKQRLRGREPPKEPTTLDLGVLAVVWA